MNGKGSDNTGLIPGWHPANYIFILDLTPGFNGLGKDNFNTRRKTFKWWDSVRLILDIWWEFGTAPWNWRSYICVCVWDICIVHGNHDDVIKWKHFPRYWPFVRGIYRSPVNFQHKGQWRRALMFSLICAWINGWVNNRETDDLRCHCTHYDVIVMFTFVKLTGSLPITTSSSFYHGSPIY